MHFSSLKNPFYSLRAASVAGILIMSMLPASGGIKLAGDLELAGQCKEAIKLKLNTASGSGSILFDLRESPIDASGNSHMGAHMTNGTSAHLDTIFKCTHEDLKSERFAWCRFFLDGGEEEQLKVLLPRPYFPEDHPWIKAFGRIRGLPAGHQSNWRWMDTSAIRLVKVTIKWDGNEPGDGVVTLSLPQGFGEYVADTMLPDDLPQPLLDKMGQLNGETWEGKIMDESELAVDGARDRKHYTNHPVGKGFSQYGGWKDGPRQEATGRFYTKKVDGKWWFVDPEGYLFWSVGVTGVGGGAPTPTSGRERFFPDLEDSPFFRVDSTKRGYDFVLSNLHRKYGKDWEAINADVTLGRMREWGMNSIGAWSVDSVLGQDKVPYTVILHPKLQGLGKLEKLPDPFSKQFRKSLKEMVIETAKKYGGDPWNLGIFIDNELKWGAGLQMANEVISLDSWVPAKKAMISLFKKKYGSIEELNAAWNTQFKSFKEIKRVEWKKSTDAYGEDMAAFTDHLTDTYFAYCAEMLDKYMPGHLYLGCRFHGSIYGGKNIIVQNAASRHVDVMSYNIYKTSVNDAKLHQEVDKPVVIGEFHSGTGSHGVWGFGLVQATSLEHQAELYEIYVNEALQNPNIVGTHWFKWSDHPTTGRYDGENYRIGIVNITDRSYNSMTGAIKNVTGNMYPLRSSTK